MILSLGGSLLRRVCRTRTETGQAHWGGDRWPDFRFGLSDLEGKGGVRPATDAARLAAPSPLGATKILDVHNIRSSGRLSIFET
jgi:hypothetical protein